MSRPLRWLAVAAGALATIVVALPVAVLLISEASLYRDYEVRAETVPVPTDPASIERGRRLGRGVAKCVICHGNNLGGKMIWSNQRIGTIAAPNVTSGRGSATAGFTVEDWVRAIRHGVGRDGEPLIYMPAQSYYLFTDEDLGAIIAWARSMPPVDWEMPPVDVNFMARLQYLRGRFPDLNHAPGIDHDAPHPGGPPPGVTAEYGRYLVDTSSCRLCHGPALAGHADPRYTHGAPSLTPDSAFGRWSREDFIRSMRTGFTPSGRQLSRALMVWDLVGELNDDELTAMWLYLRSLPPMGAQAGQASAGGG